MHSRSNLHHVCQRAWAKGKELEAHLRCVQGCTGGDWAVRLQATEVEWSPQRKDSDEQKPQRASLLFYIGSEEVKLPARIFM